VHEGSFPPSPRLVVVTPGGSGRKMIEIHCKIITRMVRDGHRIIVRTNLLDEKPLCVVELVKKD